MYNIILKKYLINTTSKGSSMVLIKSLCGMDHLVLLYTVLSSIGQSLGTIESYVWKVYMRHHTLCKFLLVFVIQSSAFTRLATDLKE